MNMSGLITFGSHCRRHINLTSLSKNDVIQELKESKRIIENKLDQYVHFLSYPGGGYNREIMDLCKSYGYSIAFKDRMEHKHHNNERYAVGRISVDQYNEGIDKLILTLATSKPILNWKTK